jgi:hypothetical protein
MTRFRLPQLFKIIPCAGILAAVCLTTGCWEEVDEFPTPTPTPLPFPTATPTPFPTATPTPTPTSSSARSTAGDVALTNADIIEAASLDAVAELAAVEESLSTDSLTKEDLAKASSSLTNAREAFLLVEPSLYYTDPESDSELTSLPPKLATSLPDLRMPGFDTLETAIQARIAGEAGATSDDDLRSAVRALRKDLQTLSDAWNANTLGNFRNSLFLPDLNTNGRIFQGMAAATDLLVLSSLRPEGKQVLPRLQALKTFLDGDYHGLSGTDIAGPGVLDLLSEEDAELAESIQATIDAIILDAEKAPTSPEKSTQALEKLHDTILAAAAALDIELVPVSQ